MRFDVQIFVSIGLFEIDVGVCVSASEKYSNSNAVSVGLDTNEWKIAARQPCATYKIHKVYWSTSKKILWNIKAENENSVEYEP